MMDQGYVISELDRCLTQLIRLGTVAEVDLSKAKVRVKLGENLTGWRPWLTTAGALKVWNPPVVGEQVVVLSPCGDLEQSVVLPSLYSAKFAAPSQSDQEPTLSLSATSSLTWNSKKDELKLQLDPDGDLEVDVDGRYLIVEQQGTVIAYGKQLFRVEDEGIQLQNEKAKILLNNDLIHMTCNSSDVVMSQDKVTVNHGAASLELESECITLQVGLMKLQLSPLGLTLNGREVLVA